MAQKKIYKLLFTFEAPDKLLSERSNRAVTLLFEEGELVIGEPYQRDKIIVEERYIIPLDYVEETKEFPYLKKDSKFDETLNRIKAQAITMSQEEKDKLTQSGGNIKDVIEGRTKHKLNGEARAYRNGALLGLGSGIILALYLKKSVWIFGLVGVALGGYVSGKIHKAKKGNNEI
jgi:hypothetical protein